MSDVLLQCTGLHRVHLRRRAFSRRQGCRPCSLVTSLHEPGGRMPTSTAQGIALGANDYIIVGVVAVVAIAALAIGFVLRREGLAADAGTPKMRDIGRAVQEGAVAYLNRQFRTLGVFVIVVFFLLLALPAHDFAEQIGRSLFFIIWGVFQATIGSLGMRMATAANIRVASAARTEGGRENATRLA